MSVHAMPSHAVVLPHAWNRAKTGSDFDCPMRIQPNYLYIPAITDIRVSILSPFPRQSRTYLGSAMAIYFDAAPFPSPAA